MQIVIDIPIEIYEEAIKSGYSHLYDEDVANAVADGTPIPDNATNGQVIQTLFKPNRVERTDDDVIVENYDFSKKWWNSPYQKGGTTRKNCEYRHENGNCLKVGGFCTSVDDEHCVKGGKE